MNKLTNPYRYILLYHHKIDDFESSIVNVANISSPFTKENRFSDVLDTERNYRNNVARND